MTDHPSPIDEQRKPENRYTIAEERFVYGGMIGFSLVIVSQALSLDKISWQMQVSLCCFFGVLLVSTPMLWHWTHAVSRRQQTEFQRSLAGLCAITCTGAMIVGVIFMAFHFGTVVGVVGLVSVAAAIALYFALC